MSDDSLWVTQNRLVVEGEQLVLHNVSNGPLDLVSLADIRDSKLALTRTPKHSFLQKILHSFKNVAVSLHPVPAVWVPSGTYLILKSIPTSLQQRHGLEEEEGAVFLRPGTRDGTCQGELRFSNGATVQLQDLRAGQIVEVLSLAGTQPTLYEAELQMK